MDDGFFVGVAPVARETRCDLTSGRLACLWLARVNAKKERRRKSAIDVKTSGGVFRMNTHTKRSFFSCQTQLYKAVLTDK